MVKTRSVTTVTVTFLVALSLVATSAAFAGTAAAEPTVSVDHVDVVEPGEQTTITVTGSATGELTVSGDVGGWIVNETDPATLLTSPNPDDTPYVSQADDVWGQVFGSVGSHSFEVTVTAPDETGTYNFTAEAKDDTAVTKNFTVTVAEPSVGVSHADGVAPGDRTEITLNGTDVSELRLDGVASGWTVVESETNVAASLTPATEDLPATSGGDDTWSASFDGVPAESSYTLTVEAPDQEGEYEFTAVGAGGQALTENFTIDVSSIVDHDSAVEPGGQTTLTVSDDQTGEFSVSGDVEGWVVNETDPAQLTTVPNPDETPYESQAGDVWGHVFASVDSHSLEMTLTAPNETGNYTFTATSKADGAVTTENFTVEVTEQTEHESGVSRDTYDTVSRGDGLDRSEILTAITRYLSGDPIGDIDLSRSDILNLIQYYLTA